MCNPLTLKLNLYFELQHSKISMTTLMYILVAHNPAYWNGEKKTEYMNVYSAP